MDQPTHAWISIRAIALLEDSKADKNLVALLKPHASKTSIGAWIPDLTDAKRGGGQTQHHVLKMLPPINAQKSFGDRFVATKKELIKRMAGGIQAKKFLAADNSLSDAWWSRPYKANPSAGQHIANRAMGLATTLRDLLIIGDKKVDALVPGKVSFLANTPKGCLTRAEQVALYCFMLSHFMADACMPCHCDGRKLSGYDEGIHKELEGYWATLVGKDFDDKALTGALAPTDKELMKKAREVDARAGLCFDNTIPQLPSGRDTWLEVVDMARLSFAIMGIMVPETICKYDDEKTRVPFDTAFDQNNPQKKKLLSDITQVALHDAVLNTAIIWLDIWKRVAKD